MSNVFAVPVFFVTFREALESSIVISVLLSFLKQTVGGPSTDQDGQGLPEDQQTKIYKRMLRQIWCGTALGCLICLIVGGGLIGAFYAKGVNHWSGTEDLWEGTFNIVASLIITIVGAAILRISKLRDKWKRKLAAAFDKNEKHDVISWSRKYFMFVLPLITILREGLEAVVFIGGVSLSAPAKAFPLPAICGLLSGIFVGVLLYKGGNKIHLQNFLIASTVFLYLVAAGLFSKGVWNFEMHAFTKLVGGDVAEKGAGPGSYDIRQSVWHVNCCSPHINGGGGWGIFYAVLGWQNSATYGSVISYNLYWVCVAAAFIFMAFREKKQKQAELEVEKGSGPGSKNDVSSDSGKDDSTVIEIEAARASERRPHGGNDREGITAI